MNTLKLFPIFLFYFVFFLFINIGHSYGQTDTRFWFAAPENTDQHDDEPIFIRVSSVLQVDVNVTVSQPASGLILKDTVLKAGTSLSFDLSSHKNVIENDVYDQVLNRGILVESTGLIFAYYDLNPESNRDIYTLKG